MQARLQLQPRNVQRLTSFIIRHFWLPVGGGVKSDSEVNWIRSFILGDPEGIEIAQRIDSIIAKLPGLEWFDRLSRSRDKALRGLGGGSPQVDDSHSVGLKGRRAVLTI